MDTLVQTLPEPETNTRNALAARPWARDLAIVGASTSMVVPALVGAGAEFAITSGVLGAVLGVALGSAIPLILSRRVRRVPLVLLALAGAGVGANWGAATGALTALALDRSVTTAVEVGATAGLLQLGWFWIPAIAARARGRSTWPLVAASVALSPLLATYVTLSLR